MTKRQAASGNHKLLNFDSPLCWLSSLTYMHQLQRRSASEVGTIGPDDHTGPSSPFTFLPQLLSLEGVEFSMISLSALK